jgi:hypothetical protein
VQANYIDLRHDWNVFFKHEHEYKAEAHTQGTAIWFGLVWSTPSAFRSRWQS